MGMLLVIVPLCSPGVLRLCHRDTGCALHSNMASNWSARSSNILPMSSRMLTVLLFSVIESFCPSSLIFSSTACSAAASEALVSSIFWCIASAVTTPATNADPVELSMDTPLIEERGGFTGGGVGMGFVGVWGVCGVWGV